MAVADTHALVWASAGKLHKLGRRARAHFERTERQRAVVYVPAVALVEIGELRHLGRISLPMAFAAWVEQLEGSGNYIVADLTADVVRVAQELFAIPEREDRLIAATARALSLPLMTRDESVARSAAVECLWD